jgi:murein DD-endopeptidase MepM/ murein hydrolase activator NlpD
MAIVSLKKRTLDPTPTSQGSSNLQAYDQQGNKVFVERGKYYPGISMTAPQNNIAPPTIAPAMGQGGTLPAGSVSPTTNPQADVFNKMLLDIFAQSKGVTSIDLLKKRRDLEKASADAVSNPIDVPAGTILSPSQQNSIIGTKQAGIQNQISENDYEIAKAEKAVSNFEDILTKTQAWGQEYADKMVVPDTVIESYKKIIEADPDKLATILSTLNDKSKNAVMAALDYTKMGKKEDLSKRNVQVMGQVTDPETGQKVNRYGYFDEKGNIVYTDKEMTTPGTPEVPTNNKTNEDFNSWKDTFKGTITQGFDTPVDYFADGRKTHSGYDIAGKLNEPITSPVSGTIVSETKASDGSGWGNSILLKDEQGNMWRMGHFENLTVKVGDKVNAGSQVVGYLGNTGNVMKGDGTKPNAEELAAGRGTHLHIEAKDSSGNFIDVGKIQGSQDIPEQWQSALEGKTTQQIANFQKLSEIDKSSVAQLIDGDALLNDIMASRGVQGSAARQSLLAKAQTVDPNFSENVNKQRNTFKTQWNNTNGKAYNVRMGVNTAFQHLARLKELTDQLSSNSNFKKANSIGQYIQKNINGPQNETIAQFQDTVSLLATEIAKAYKGGVPDQLEVQQQINSINSIAPQNVLTAIINNKVNLMSGLLTAQATEYEKVMGKFPADSIVNETSLDALRNAGVTTSHIEDILKKQGVTINTPVTKTIIYQGKKYNVDANGDMTLAQ